MKTSCHINLLKIGFSCSCTPLLLLKKNEIYCNLKDIDMSISPIENFIILTDDVALLTKIFMGKKANLVKFIWFVKYFFNVFAAD